MPILLVLIMTRSAAAARGTGSMSDHFLAFYRDSVLNRLYNDFPGAIDGSTWPPGAVAQTMSGVRRADNVVSLLAAAVEDGIPGHFIETGAWLRACCLAPAYYGALALHVTSACVRLRAFAGS